MDDSGGCHVAAGHGVTSGNLHGGGESTVEVGWRWCRAKGCARFVVL